MEDECEECEGHGVIHHDCGVCNGEGWVEDPSDGGTMTCPECENEQCTNCGGNGYI